jgi:hypothetical protein
MQVLMILKKFMLSACLFMQPTLNLLFAILIVPGILFASAEAVSASNISVRTRLLKCLHHYSMMCRLLLGPLSLLRPSYPSLSSHRAVGAFCNIGLQFRYVSCIPRFANCLV